jgi:acetyl-CoA C-acetyltransferase
VPRDRWLFAPVGVESSFEVPLSNRRHVHRWPAMEVLGRAAAQRMDRPVHECDHVEIYSCFPAAVRVQQRELGFPLDRTPTITGGMTFAGGPFNNFVLNATAAMARKLREQPGLGVVTTVSGLLTKPGLAVWATEPDGRPPLVGDFGDEARAATATVDVKLGHQGEATVVACTVTYTGQERTELVAVLETAEGERVIAKSTEPSLVRRGTEEELVGQTFGVAGNTLVT